jgi:hypothetical protein
MFIRDNSREKLYQQTVKYRNGKIKLFMRIKLALPNSIEAQMVSNATM